MSTPSQFFSRPIEERSIYGYRKNLIINGCGRVNQRGASHSSTIDDDEFILDRWFMQEDSTGSYNRMFGVYTGTEWMFGVYTGSTVSFGADDYIAPIAQKLEAQDLRGLENGGTLTLSFKARVPVDGTYSVGLYIFGASDNYRVFKTFDLTTSLTSVEMTFEIPSGYADPTLGTVQGLMIDIFGFGGSNRKAPAVDTWYTNSLYRAGPAVTNWTTGGGQVRVSDVQLEFGSNATEFEKRYYGEELALCQRYYQILYAVQIANGYANTTTTFRGLGNWRRDMRTTPTFDNNSGTLRLYGNGVFHTATSASLGNTGIVNAAGTGFTINEMYTLYSSNTAYLDAEL